jgi:hypothetical protein
MFWTVSSNFYEGSYLQHETAISSATGRQKIAQDGLGGSALVLRRDGCAGAINVRAG